MARFLLADNIRKLKRLINMSFFVKCKEAGMQFEVQLNQQGRGEENSVFENFSIVLVVIKGNAYILPFFKRRLECIKFRFF